MKVGRNDPCPCGSGKKYKNCCLSSAAKVSDELQDLIAEQDFDSIEEVQAFTNEYMQHKNRKPSDDFCGLSPEQMYQILNFQFDCSDIVFFPNSLNAPAKAPLQTLFDFIVDAIADEGLKATAKGNLPQKFCRESALKFWGEQLHQEKTRFGGINKEEDFLDLHITRLVAELAGFITKRKGKFHLTKSFRDLQGGDPFTVYPRLFRTYVLEFNWGYWDRHEEANFIQQSFVYSLYLLNLFGNEKHSQTFYEDRFLQAFPSVLEEFQETIYSTPEKDFRHCYTYRTIIHFIGFLGLAKLEEIPSGKPYSHEYNLKKSPLLDEIMKFQIHSNQGSSNKVH